VDDRPDRKDEGHSTLDELRESLGGAAEVRHRRPDRAKAERRLALKRPTWHGFARWLIVVALVVDILAMLSYISDQRFFRSLAHGLVAGRHLSDQDMLALFVDYAHDDLRRPTYRDLPSPLIRLYYKFNPLHPSARNVVKYGCDYRGGCGSSSRVVMALLSAEGIPSRSMILLDGDGRRVHAVVNARIEGRWAVADPLYGIVFLRADSTVATAEDLHADRELFLTNAAHHPTYPAEVYNYDHYALFNWNKVPVVLPAIRRTLVRTIGEERTAAITRPRIWMYPLPAFAAALSAFTLVLAAIVFLRRRRS
jgi:hypothetical protein